MRIRHVLQVVVLAGALLALWSGVAAAAAPAVRGWAFVGEDMPLRGSTVTVVDAEGNRIAGLTGTTGMHGEFFVPLGETLLPQRATVVVRGGLVAGKPLQGRLRAQIPVVGPARHIVHVTPVSTVSLALRAKYPAWTKGRADRRAAELIGAPRIRHGKGHPHVDAGALLKHSSRHVHAPSLHRHATRLGGYVAWEKAIAANHADGTVTRYRTPKSRSTRQVLQVLSFAWSMVSNAASSCDPSSSAVPGLGMIASAVAGAGLVNQDPACGIAAVAAKLDAIKAQIDQMEATLNQQSLILGSIQNDIRQDAYANAVNSFSGTTAAISTVQLDTQLLVDTLASYQAPRSATNPSGLGMGVDQIFASTDPAVKSVATSLRNMAIAAQGPSTSGWDTAYARFTQDGVVVPGSSSKGLIRLGWEAVRTTSPFVDATQLRNFTAIDQYYRSLYTLLGVQQVDEWRRQGVPNSLIQTYVAQRQPFDTQLGKWIPRIPVLTASKGSAKGPMIDPVTGYAWAVVCQAPGVTDPTQCPPEGAWAMNAEATAPADTYDPLTYWMPAALPSLGDGTAPVGGFTWPTNDQLATLTKRASAAGISGADNQAKWLDAATETLRGTATRPVFAPVNVTYKVTVATLPNPWNPGGGTQLQEDKTSSPGVYWGCETNIYLGCSNGYLPPTQPLSYNPEPSPGLFIYASGRMLTSGSTATIGPSVTTSGNAPNKVRCPAGPAACRPDTWKVPLRNQLILDGDWRMLTTTGIPLVVTKLSDPSVFLPFPG